MSGTGIASSTRSQTSSGYSTAPSDNQRLSGELVADMLMGLYQSGWEPMTPLEMWTKRDKSGTRDKVTSSKVDFCFRIKEEGEMLGSSYSICRESLADVLYEVVGAIQDKWAPGIQGVSVGVASVIQVRPGL